MLLLVPQIVEDREVVRAELRYDSRMSGQAVDASRPQVVEGIVERVQRNVEQTVDIPILRVEDVDERVQQRMEQIDILKVIFSWRLNVGLWSTCRRSQKPLRRSFLKCASRSETLEQHVDVPTCKKQWRRFTGPGASLEVVKLLNSVCQKDSAADRRCAPYRD